MIPRALLLLLTLLLAFAGSGALARADDGGVCASCFHTFESHYYGGGGGGSCGCCNGPGGGGTGGGENPWADGGHPLIFELVTFPIVGPIFFIVGFGAALGWIFVKLTGGTDEDIFQYSGFTEQQGSWPIMALATGLGALMAGILYLPAAGLKAIGGGLIDDDEQAKASVSARAETVRKESRSRYLEFVGAYPSVGPAEPVDLRHLEERDLTRARADEAVSAAREVSAIGAAAPAGPAWPTTTGALAIDARPAFVVPPPPDGAARRAAGVLERAKGLLDAGAAAARDNLIADVKERAMGLLPEGVERALKAHEAAREGTLGTLVRVRDEGVEVFAHPSWQGMQRFGGELGHDEVTTAERAVDEAQGYEGDDRLLEWARGGLRGGR